MALMDTVKNKVTGLLTPAKLEKAKLIIQNSEPGAALQLPASAAAGNMLTVQFNPAEYSLERRVHLSRRRQMGENRDPAQTPVTSADGAVLSLALYFDSITDLHSTSASDLVGGVKANGLAATAKSLAVDQFWRASSDNPVSVADQVAKLLKFSSQRHQPPVVCFVWGQFQFEGKVEHASVQYTMFTPNGVPVQARVQLRISGEEKAATQAARQNTPQSPDRTKERTLAQGDQLWMIAGQEYCDPGKWKVIAEANGILNPRALESAAVLKVPSIK